MSVAVTRTPIRRSRISRGARRAAFASAAAMALTLLSSTPASAGVYGPYEFKNLLTKGCLGNSYGLPIAYPGCKPGDFDDWTVTTYPSGYVSLKHVRSGQCLDVDLNKNVRVKTCNNSNYQAFLEDKSISPTIRRYKPYFFNYNCIGPESAANPGIEVLGSCGTDNAKWEQTKV